jgi:hypothetical protein
MRPRLRRRQQPPLTLIKLAADKLPTHLDTALIDHHHSFDNDAKQPSPQPR